MGILIDREFKTARGGDIIIMLPGTKFMVTYYKSDGSQLVAKSDWTDDHKDAPMLKRIVTGVVLALMLTGGAVAGPFEEADDAYKRGDYATALRLLRPLAEQGNADALLVVGLLSAKGEGVPQDYAEAMKWFRLAAEQGDADAQYNLGVIYANGEGVPQDYVQAHQWYNLAASRYSASQAAGRNDAVHNRDLVASHMTPEQLAEAQRLAREWKPK
jgi:uncharacterized protein